MPSIINATTTNGLSTSADNSGSLQLATNNGTTAVTIDTSQNVGIGTSSPTAKLTINTSASAGIHVFRSDANANFDGIVFRNSANNTNQSKIGWNGNDLRFESTGNTLFETNGSERMRVVSNGELGYLCTGLDGDRPNAVGTYKQTNGNSKVRVNGDGTAAFQFYSPTGGGSPVGSISANASSTTYATSSDYRLKENIAPMTGALTTVQALKPVTYDWKAGGSSQGFIAHELQAVVPDAVIGEKDAVNEDGSIKPQGIDTSFLVATLTAAIQELNAKVEAQAVRIAELEGAK